MIRSAVTVSLVPQAAGGPFVFWNDLEHACSTAHALGFDAVEIFAPDASIFAAHDVGGMLDRCGLSLAAAGTGAGFLRLGLTLTSPESDVRRQAVQFIRSMIDAAGSLKAPAIIGSMQGRWGNTVARDAALDMLRDSLAELGEHSRTYGQPLLYEPLNRYETNLLTTLADSVEFVKTIPNVLLLADAFHMNIEEADPAAALKAAGSSIGHYHFADSNRHAAGWGHTDFASQAKALREIDYAGFVSAEALPLPDSTAAAKQTMASFNKFFRS